jgi:antitoxin ParD1/3/4
MNISLPPDVGALIRAKLETGCYATAGDVLREALRQMRKREDDREHLIAELNAMIDDGLQQIARGETIPVDEAIAEIRGGIPTPPKARA